jgi:DNA-binding beta-propeller fold protein YncE
MSITDSSAALDAELAAASLAQLSFVLGNPPLTPPVGTIYITTKPGVNKLELRVTTTTDGTGFTPGTPVPPDKASTATGSLIYLDLTQLGLSTAEFDALTSSGAGWTVQGYPAERQLCMTPEAPVALDRNQVLTFEIDGLILSDPPSGATVPLLASYYRVEKATTQNLGRWFNFKSALQQEPSGKGNLHSAISVRLEPGGVVLSTTDYPNQPNAFKLILYPGPNPRKIPATATSAFTLTFVYADPVTDPAGYGALCTTGQALEFTSARGPGAAKWGLTDPSDQQNPAWLLTPEIGKPIIGSGAGATVQFDLGDVVSDFQPGPTVAILSYSGIEGYADGAYTMLIDKYGHASVSALDVTPNPSELDEDGTASVTLTWRAANFKSLTLGYDDVTHDTSYPAQIPGTTPFTLIAEGEQPGGQPNRATRDATAFVLPVVNSFEADPFAVYSADFARKVRLSWNVRTNDNVRLISSTGGDDTEYPPVSYVDKHLDGPQMLTLVPVADPDDLKVRRSLIVSAFKAAAPAMSSGLGFGPTCVAIAPTTGFVVVSSPSQSAIVALDTLVYQPAGTVDVGSAPSGLCYAPDGARLYALAAGAGTISVITPQLGTAPPLTYSMTVVGMVALGGAPQEVATSPNGRYVYATVDRGADPGTLEVLQADTGGTLTKVASLPVGRGPRGVAVTGSGAHVYVASPSDGLVTIIGVGVGGKHSVVGRIKLTDKQPTGLAVSLPDPGVAPDGGVLLVTCAATGELIAIDTRFPQTTRSTLKVGANPTAVALVPGGAYAVVANRGPGTLSLIGLGPDPSTCTVLGDVPAGAGVSDVAVSPDAGIAVAACPGANAVAAVNLEQYAAQAEPVPAGVLPTSVAAAPDGSQAVIWHNALIKSTRPVPSLGVFAYSLHSSQIEAQLTNLPVVAFAFARGDVADRAFLLTLDYHYVTIVDTSSWNPAGSFDLSSQTKGQGRSLAATADGTTLFVLAADATHSYDLVALSVAAGTGSLSAINTLSVFSTKLPGISALAAAPDGSRAFVLDSLGQHLWVAERGRDGKYVLGTQPLQLGEQATALAMAPDGSRLFVLLRPGANNVLTSIDLKTMGTQSTVLPSGNYTGLNGITVSPDGDKLLATDGVIAGIRIFDTASLRLNQTISWPAAVSGPSGIAVMPDGSQLFTANTNSNNLGLVQQVQPSTPLSDNHGEE